MLESTDFLSVIRQCYCPISGKSRVKNVVRLCTGYFYVNPLQVNPIMGDLHPFRVLQSGVNNSEQILNTRQSRKTIIYKAYVNLFVCLSTLTVHRHWPMYCVFYCSLEKF